MTSINDSIAALVKLKDEILQSREQNRKSCAKWRQAHPDRAKAAVEKYITNNPERRKANALKWKRANPKNARAARLQREYGITLQEYEALLKQQNNCCAICSCGEPKDKAFCVDHNHQTGAIRSLLCHRCNSALGLADESSARLRNMADYIDFHTNKALIVPRIA